MFDLLKKHLKKSITSRGWFVRKIAGLPAGILLDADWRHAQLPEPQVILDVGAHRGETCVASADFFPKALIHAFEPVRENFTALCQLTRNLPQVHCHAFALGERSEKITIQLQADSQTHSLQFQQNSGPAPSGRTEEIEVQTVDAFAQAVDLQKIDLLKIDTEGFELPVLRGAIDLLQRRAIRAVFLEASLLADDKVHTPLPAAIAFLENHGFQLAAIYDQNLLPKPTPHLAYFNALFVHPRPV